MGTNTERSYIASLGDFLKKNFGYLTVAVTGDISEATRILLVNVLHLKSDWVTPFDPETVDVSVSVCPHVVLIPVVVVFSACGGICTGICMPVLTAFFPVLA